LWQRIEVYNHDACPQWDIKGYNHLEEQ